MRVPKRSITGADWLGMKPYDRFGSYDQFYLKLAQEIHELIKQEEIKPFFLALNIDNDQEKTLAIILVSYFEDQVNQIGLWQAVVDQFRAEFGYSVPFFDLEDYEDGELNWQDLAFLIWYFFSQVSGQVISVEHPLVKVISTVVSVFFKAQWDRAPQTDFYEEYLIIDPEEERDFFLLKEKLSWLALDSYLMRLDLGGRFKDSLEKVIGDRVTRLDEGLLHGVSYTMQNTFIFGSKSSMGGFHVPQLLSRVIDASDEFLASLEKPFPMYEGRFKLTGKDDQYYHFLDLKHDLDIPVVLKSVEMAQELYQPDSSFYSSLVKWKGEWWVSGFVISQEHKKDESAAAALPFALLSEEQQKTMRESTEIMKLVFQEKFGRGFRTFESVGEANEQIGEFLTQYNEAIMEELDEKRALDQVMPNLTEAQADKHGRVGIGFDDGGGLMIMPTLPGIIDLLQQEKDWTEEEEAQLYFSLFESQMPIGVGLELLANYPVGRIKEPVPASNRDVIPYAKYLLCFSDPESFGDRNPQMEGV